MAYDPYEAVKKIYNLKNDWDNYNKAGDTAGTSKAAKEAEQYYKELAQYGYGGVADELSKQNYEQAKKTHDYYGMMGKTGANNYLGTLGSSYGLNQSQIDALLSNNPTTGEMSFGGINIGTPYSTVNGMSYWDEGVLNDAFNNYAKTSGLSQNLYSQYNNSQNKMWDYYDNVFNQFGADSQNISNKNNQYWDTLNNDKADMGNRYSRLEDFNYSNPFETETGKSVLERYDLAGLQGRDNQAAQGGANNSGNIDSYSAANALRQQASLRNLGEQTALAAHSRTVNDGRGILGDRGSYLQGIYDNMVNSINTDINQSSANMDKWNQLLNTGFTQSQQLFDNDQTDKNRLFYEDQTSMNNAVARDSTRADITGNVPARTLAQNMGLIDDKGNIINPNVDLHAKINELTALLEKTADPTQRQNINSQIEALKYARDVKIGLDPYKQYANDVVGAGYYYNPTATAATNQFNANIAQQNKELNANTGLGYANIDLQKYNIDSNERSTMATLANNLKQVTYTTDSNERINMGAQANDLLIAREGYASGLQQAMINGDVQKYLADASAKSNERIANIQSALGRYQADSQTAISLNQLLSNEKQFNAQLSENARQFNVNIRQSDANRAESARQFDVTQGNSAGTANASGSGDDWAGIDMASVINLGKGTISRSQLEQWVEQGYVIAEKAPNGKIIVKWANE